MIPGPETLWLIASATTSLLLCAALAPIARRLGWLDHPDPRKVHREPTPLVGGVAVFLALFGALYASGRGNDWLLVASAIALVTGLIDDRRPLSAGVRFALQALAVAVMIFLGDVALTDFGRLFWDRVQGLGPLAVPITIFAALGVINAFNMMDGLDGLGGGVFIVCAIALALLAGAAGQGGAVFLLLLAASAVYGFLMLNARFPWNRRARVFLGDSGSTFLGLFLAWMFVALGSGVDRAYAPMTAVWIIGLPLLDTTRLIWNRWRRGLSPFEADATHLHHAFLRAGFGVGATSLIIIALCAAFAAVGVLTEIYGVPEYWRFYAYIAVGLAYLHIMKKAWQQERFLGRPFQPHQAT